MVHERECATLTNANQASGTITPVNTIGQRIKWAREQIGMSQVELARRVGVSKGTIGNLEAGTRQNPRDIVRIAKELQQTPEWLSTGVDEPATPPASGLTLEALSKKLDFYTVPPTKTMEEIVAGVDLGDEFRHALADDALAPEHPAGTDMVWSTSKQPKIGSVVLVVDAHNQLHARRYAQGRMPGQWLANAVHPAYASFDSQADGLRVVAVAKYREML